MSEPIGILYVIDELTQMGGAEQNLVRTLHHLPRDRFRPSVLTFRLNSEVEAFRTLPCPVEVFPVHNIYGMNALRYAPRLVRWMDREHIRVVHTFFETSDLWAGGIAKLRSDAVVISSRRDLGINRNWRLDLIYRLFNGMFDQVQAVSDQVRDYVIETDHANPASVVTVPNAIHLGSVPKRGAAPGLRASINLPSDRPIIATVANIRPVKGIDVLLRTAAGVREKRPDALFLIVGRVIDEPYYAELLKLAETLDVQDSVRFLGALDNPLDLLAESDLFYLPSRSEGMSNALLEAMACTLPVVATAVGGNCQLVQEGQNGFLVPVEDVEAATARLLDILENPDLAQSMGSAARTLIEQKYSTKVVLDLLLRQYDQLLGSCA